MLIKSPKSLFTKDQKLKSTMLNIFDKKYIELFMPYEGVEYIHSIIQSLGYGIEDFKSPEVRIEALEAIRQLLDLEILEIYKWGGNENNIEVSNLSNKEILHRVEQLWFIGADYVDF